MPAFANSLVTNCVGVIPEGNADKNRERCTNSNAKACLLSSRVCCQLPWPTTTPVPISCVSGRNSSSLIGTGALGIFPYAAL